MTEKEIKNEVKKQLKEKFPNRKIRVTISHEFWMWFFLNIKIENLTKEEEKTAYEIANQYVIDNSDPYTDYFDCNYQARIYSI